MADAETIHAVAELLFRAAAEHDPTHLTRFSSELDIPSRVKYSTVTVPVARLPDHLKSRIDESVERNVIAYLADLSIICKMTKDANFGRAFFLSLPGELVGLSWDEVLRRLGLPGGETKVMPTKKPAPLPESLRYLQPVANALAKLPPEDLNEDVDPTRLEEALRKRIRDLDLEAAEAQLAEDRDRLERWLEDKPDHPAHWILGFILSPTLATDLTQPVGPPPRGAAEPVPQGPKIDFVPPEGWRVKELAPYLLQLKKGTLSGSVMAIDEGLFHQTQREREGDWVVSPGVEATRDIQVAQYGRASGKKYVYRRIAPDPSKRVDYVLSVPGGFAMAGIEAAGADFDEAPFEAQLHTVQVSASA